MTSATPPAPAAVTPPTPPAPAAPGRDGLHCPDCRSPDLRVWYTRQRRDQVQRVRICSRCGRRVVTRERVAGALGG